MSYPAAQIAIDSTGVLRWRSQSAVVAEGREMMGRMGERIARAIDCGDRIDVVDAVVHHPLDILIELP